MQQEALCNSKTSLSPSKSDFANKGPSSLSYVFSSSHVQMWELDHKKVWAWKNWCLQIVVLEKILESPLDSREIKPVSLKGNKPWILIERNDSEAEAPVFWPPDVNSQLIGKVPDAGKDWGQREKRASEDEMTGWHHQCNGHELGQTLEDGEEQRPGVLQSMGSQSWTWLGDWTT